MQSSSCPKYPSPSRRTLRLPRSRSVYPTARFAAPPRTFAPAPGTRAQEEASNNVGSHQRGLSVPRHTAALRFGRVKTNEGLYAPQGDGLKSIRAHTCIIAAFRSEFIHSYGMFHPTAPNFRLSRMSALKNTREKQSFLKARGLEHDSYSSS